MRRTLQLCGAVIVLLIGGAAVAIADQANFKSPSGNIFCSYFDYDGPPEVRCDILNSTRSFRKPPSDCDLEWGDSFAVSATAKRGEVVCHGDTVMTPDAAPLPYNRSFQQGGITCTSSMKGLACVNAKGHGFFVSRAKQQVF
ncbi:DUF6636 domain-containing protein [Aestuariivirga sp.]|uniref:DUF6636 domain-containing protein n=1 Tax=Aestuariivirga sp. TaxID=2650926 RepID=UPI0039E53740